MRPYVLGNEDCVLGFSLVSVDGEVVRAPQDLTLALDRCLADKTIGLLFITADVACWAQARIDALKVNSLSPLVVEVPGAQEGAAYASLQDLVQRAVGIRLGGY